MIANEVSGTEWRREDCVCCKLRTIKLVLALFLCIQLHSSCQLLTTEAATFRVLVTRAVVNGTADTRPCHSLQRR
jgi:hypothetical protein